MTDNQRVAGIYNAVTKLVHRCEHIESLHALKEELWPATFDARSAFGSNPDTDSFSRAGFMSVLMQGTFSQLAKDPEDDKDLFGPPDPKEVSIAPDFISILYRADPPDDWGPSVADYVQVIIACEEVRYYTTRRYDDEIEEQAKPLGKVVARILGKCFAWMKGRDLKDLTASWALFNLLQSAYDRYYPYHSTVREVVKAFSLNDHFSIDNYGMHEAVTDWRKWQFEKIPEPEAMRVVLQASGSWLTVNPKRVGEVVTLLKKLKYKPLEPVVTQLKVEVSKKRVSRYDTLTMRSCEVTGRVKRGS